MVFSPDGYPAIGDQINTNHINWLNKNLSDLHDYSPIWADEPNWTKFHAASWHALRNDNWTNMGFSPKALAKNSGIIGGKINSEAEFVKTTSAYSALIDVLTLGGNWANPMQIFDYLHVLSPEDLGFSKKFVNFWLPMLNQLGAWMNYSHAIDNSHPFQEFNIIRPGDLILAGASPALESIEFDQPDSKWNATSGDVGGYDVLHLSHHSLKPLQIDHDELKLSGSYCTLNSPTYSGWAYRLLNNLYFSEPTLVRVNVGVHGSMEASTTLGHFLLSRGETPAQGGTSFPVEIRYVNDRDALEMLSHGVIATPTS